jgi:predicted PurR-regulated permease PerM
MSDQRAPGPNLRAAVLWTLTAVVTVAVIVATGFAILDLGLAVFAAILVAIVLRAAARGLHRVTRIPVGFALAVVILLIVGGLGAAIALLAEPAAAQASKFAEIAPKSIDTVRARLEELPWASRIAERLDGGAPPFERIFAFAGSGLRALSFAVVIVVTGIYLAASPATYVDGVVRLLPVARRARGRAVLLETGETLERFLVGRIVSMVAVGVLTGVLLALLGVPLALLLAVIAGLLTFVPYVGPMIAAVPIGLVTLVTSETSTVLWALAGYAAIQSLEGFVITPIAQKRAVALPPALTLVGEVAMGLLFGAFGVVISVPFTAALLVIVRKVYVEGHLEAVRPSTA